MRARSAVDIGGFRDTYLGKQVVSRPGGPRARMGSAGGLGALRAPLSGFGAEPHPKSNLLPFSPKNITSGGNNFDNFQCNADHKLQSQKYLGRHLPPL